MNIIARPRMNYVGTGVFLSPKSRKENCPMELKMFDQVYEVAENSSVGDLIKANFPDDLKKYLAVKLEDGTMQDLFAPVAASQTVTPVTFDDPEGR